MKLTALEIKQQQFEKSMRGYDPSEVHSYLNLLATEWEYMAGKIRELENQLDKLNDKLKHYERVEEALHETLQTAKSSSEEKLNSARKEAKNIVEKAELDAETIYQEAHRDRWRVRQHTLQIVEKREEMIRSLSSFLENTSKSLNQFSDDKQSLFSLPDVPENEELHNSSSKTKKIKEKEKRKNSGKKDKDEDFTPEPDIPGSENIDDILDEIE
ncbi:MAG: DivIVA domain-containing protein [Balneolaceae bacterium]